MKLDLYTGQGLRLREAAGTAVMAEDAGFSGLWSLEAHTEPFLPLALAAEHTTGLELRTAVAVALARNPVVVAHVAHELNEYSDGRFQLGLGTQVKPHITRRYGEQWADPVGRMREFIAALKAIWACWNEGTALDFVGSYYTHTLMTPAFTPEASRIGAPPVLLAAVGPKMARLAAQAAQGIIAHPLSSPKILTEQLVPIVRSELTNRSDGGDFEISCPVLVITGTTDQQQDLARTAVRKQIAFYASTPSYRPVFEAYDEGDRADRLRALSVEGRWDDMAALVTDELVNEFSVEARPQELASSLHRRFGGILQRLSLYAPYPVPNDTWVEVMSSSRRQAEVGRP